MCKKKKVDLFIKVCQNLKGEFCDRFQLFTTGKIKKGKEKYIIEYDNEYHGTSTILLKDDGRANIKTNGDINYVLNLDKEKKTKFNISTKDTFSNFYVNTKNVFFNINENGGNINFEYDLEIDNVGGMLSTKINIELKS